MHPSPFAEDDEQRPGEDVTSTSKYQIFDQRFDQGSKTVPIKMADLAGRRNQKESTHNAKETPRCEKKRRRCPNTAIYGKTRNCNISPQNCRFLQQDGQRSKYPIPYSRKIMKTAESVEKCWKCLF